MAKKQPEPEKRRPGRPATGKQPMRSFRISDEEYALMRQAAELAGKPVSEWLRDVAVRAAKRAIAAK